MKKPVLVVMAAGMGSRYGGLKQIDPVDQEGQIIIDFSIYDAVRAGFEKVVFIIKKENEADFKAAIGDRMSKQLEVAYVFQDLHNIPEGYEVPADRVKPWGTGHAIMSCIDEIDGPFAVINADDYYGSHAFQMAYDFLSQNQDEADVYQYMMVGYQLDNTLTDNGHVARGVCVTDENGYLQKINERTRIEKKDGGAAYTEDDGETWVSLPTDCTVSMNMWGFSATILKELKERFAKFLDENLEKNPLKCEYFLPFVVDELLAEKKATVKVLKSMDKWYGVTYKEDKPMVMAAIQKLKDEGRYPKKIMGGSVVEYKEEMKAVIEQFGFEGELKECIPYGSGHINDTFRLTFEKAEKTQRYILQRMNKSIFTKPVELMENIVGVTSWLKKKIQENGGDVERETLNLVPDKEGKLYHVDEAGEYWRVYLFIEHASCYDQVEKDDDFYQSAVAFGNFQRLLADYPAHTLHETIPNFHNTVDRFGKFCAAVQADVCGRAKDVQEEIAFVMEREALAHTLCDLQDQGGIPLRVTHNDTKLNNIMIDDATGKAVCVIDLDTVMPGLAVNDFGDSIRFGASTGLEDEKDLSKISCDLHLYEVYVKGFIEGCAGALTQTELDMLPMGAMLMTFECGMRFLTDYLEGDTYFKIHREGHNLDRCRTQFKLVKDMEEKLEQMKAIVKKYE